MKKSKLKQLKNKSSYLGRPTKFDVNGSYTGTPNQIEDLPIQDADDL